PPTTLASRGAAVPGRRDQLGCNRLQPGHASLLPDGPGEVYGSPVTWQLEQGAPRGEAGEKISARARYRDRQSRLGNPANRANGRKKVGWRDGDGRRDTVLRRPQWRFHRGR